jgi:GDP/UDP-N,N'-diacetylbacillosamine 2-epimerase (hydrolysing)
MKRKVCVVVASRANYGRIKAVMQAIGRHPDLELQLIVGASALLERYGRAIDVIRADGFEPDATVYLVLEGETPATMAKSTGLGIMELATAFDHLRPDIVLTVADRYETMATAVASSYMNIPLAHTQGGEVTGSIDESVRHAITKLAHIHFPTTELSRQRLLRMGESPDRIFVTGCPSIDAIAGIDLTLKPETLARTGVGASIDPASRFLLVLQHPVTTEYQAANQAIEATIEAIRRLKRPTVWLWPNVDAGSDVVSKRLRQFRENDRPDYVHFYRNFSVEDYARVMNAAGCIVGNTSSSIREGAFLGTPAVNIGSRQQGRERACNVVDVPNDAAAIEAAIRRQLEHGKYPSSSLYGDGKAAPRIAGHLASVALTPIQKCLAY